MRAYLLASLLFATACSSSDSMQPIGDCPAEAGDAGSVAAGAAERCNVPMSMGTSHWYRIYGLAPADNLTVQVELWDNRGAFAGGAVHTGTFTLADKDLDPATCGVCLRALSDYGMPTAKEFFATGGTVDVTAVAPTADAPFTATVTGAAFDQINPTAKTPVSGGCSTTLDNIQLSGTMVLKGGTGGSGGGGGGSGANGCKTTIGDP